MGNKIDPKIEVLRQFRKYEDILYSYLKEDYKTKDSEYIKFYLIPKKYVVVLTEMFKYKDNIKELNELNAYLDNPENLDKKEKETIIEDLINDFKKKNNSIFDIQIELKKVKNKKMQDEENNKSLKLNDEGEFIPLTNKIWKTICHYYNNDIELCKDGFINKGELSIKTEKKRIDTFFIEEETGDFIYHFCLIMNNENDLNNVISFLKNNSIKFLLDKLEIKHVGQDIEKYKFSKMTKTIPFEIERIGNLCIEVYFIGLHMFHENNIYFIPKKKICSPSPEIINNIHYLKNKMKDYNNYIQCVNPQNQNINNINNINIKSNIFEKELSIFKNMKEKMNFNLNMAPIGQIKESTKYSNIYEKIVRAKSNNYKYYNTNNNVNNNLNNHNKNMKNGNNQILIMSNTLLEMNKPQSSKLIYMNTNSNMSPISSSNIIDKKENILSSNEEMKSKFELNTFFSDDFSSYVNVFIQCFLNVTRIKRYFANLSIEEVNQNKSSLLSLLYFLQKEINSKDRKRNNINYCLDNIYKYLKKGTKFNSRLNDVILLILDILYKGNQKEAEREIRDDIYIDRVEAKKNITQGSEISQYYSGVIKKRYLCTKCQARNYKYKAFNILSIDVDKLYSDIYNSINGSIIHFDFRNNLIKGNSKIGKNSKYSCKNCSNKKFIKEAYINKICPKLLFISFEKQQGFIQQYSFSIDLVIDLDMNKYIENKSPKSNYNYYLNSFIVYDSSQAEYITYLNFRRNIWLKMDKKGMKKIKHLSEEMDKIMNPQILLYEKC